jgi:hypothetical protein
MGVMAWPVGSDSDAGDFCCAAVRDGHARIAAASNPNVRIGSLLGFRRMFFLCIRFQLLEGVQFNTRR